MIEKPFNAIENVPPDLCSGGGDSGLDPFDDA
jgi:hypothetical protein